MKIAERLIEVREESLKLSEGSFYKRSQPNIEEWIKVGFTPEEAKEWYEAGITDPKKARELSDKGLRYWEVEKEDKYGSFMRKISFKKEEWEKEGIPGSKVYYWYEAGWTDPKEAARWYKAGWEASTAKEWLEAGWKDPSEALRWLKAGFAFPRVAKRWRRQGFTPEEAKQWVGYEIPPEKAKKLKEMGYDARSAYLSGKVFKV